MWRRLSALLLSFLLSACLSPSSAFAQDSTGGKSSPDSSSSAGSSQLLSEDALKAAVTKLLTGVSPELKPTLIQVLTDSSARQKLASKALTQAQDDLAKQKALWIQAQVQLTTLSQKIESERMVTAVDKWLWVGGTALTAVAVTFAADELAHALKK